MKLGFSTWRSLWHAGFAIAVGSMLTASDHCLYAVMKRDLNAEPSVAASVT